MFQTLPVQAIVGKGEAGAVVHRVIVVDDRDLPPPDLLRGALRAGVIDQLDDLVISHAPCPSLCSAGWAGLRRVLRAER